MATITPYGLAAESLGVARFNLSTQISRVMLVTSAYVPDKDVHRYKSNVTDEITGTGYTAKGVQLANVTWTYDAANDRMVLNASSVIWSMVTFNTNPRYGVLYRDTATASSSPLLAWIDFGSDQEVSASSFIINWPAEGILHLTT